MQRKTIEYTLSIWILSIGLMAIFFNWIAYPFLLDRIQSSGGNIEIIVFENNTFKQLQYLALTIMPSIFVFGICVNNLKNEGISIWQIKAITVIITMFLLMFIMDVNLKRYLSSWNISETTKFEFKQLISIASLSIFTLLIGIFKYPPPNFKDTGLDDIDHLVE